MSAPLTSSDIPIKNQIEIEDPGFITVYQKMMFKMTNASATTAAQKIGR